MTLSVLDNWHKLIDLFLNPLWCKFSFLKSKALNLVLDKHKGLIREDSPNVREMFLFLELLKNYHLLDQEFLSVTVNS